MALGADISIASEDARIGTRQSMGPVGSCFDNALPETPHLKLNQTDTCPLLAVWCLRKPDVQNRPAPERPASRLIWEQIWEQNTAKPAGIGAMWCNRLDS